ncbi:MAG: hypothetical protein HY615_03550 [Candidatus Rokubacteria bacterium]|nr:hypothetical protein [Candidatus Rokubacteria bacterium]
MVDHYVLESSLPSSYFVVGLEMAAAESYVSRGFFGESVASVKSRLHRARMALRERLTRFMTADAPTEPAVTAPVSQGCRKASEE